MGGLSGSPFSERVWFAESSASVGPNRCNYIGFVVDVVLVV
jgi:hypothetical protein